MTTTPLYEYMQVYFPQSHDDEPFIVIYGVNFRGQLELLDSMAVGPFPDWEALSRRVMRQVVLASRRSVP